MSSFLYKSVFEAFLYLFQFVNAFFGLWKLAKKLLNLNTENQDTFNIVR